MATKHIAVIVVHGVGDPGPGASVGDIASLLLGLRDNEHTRFQPFSCESIQVGVRGAPSAEPLPSSTGSAVSRRWKWLDERASEFAARETHPRKKNVEGALDGIAYTRDQLLKYKTNVGRNEATYSTTRLKGVRRGTGQGEDKTVDLYELYWADLVSLRKGLRLLEDLYQLLFHIAHLGLLAINSAMATSEFAKLPQWRAFSFFHRWAVRCLTLPIPILNLMSVPVVAFALTALIPLPALPVVACALIAVVVLTGSGMIFFSMACQQSQQKCVIAFVSLLGIGAAAEIACWRIPCANQIVVGMIAFAFCMKGVLMLLTGYETVRPGASWCGRAIGAVVSAYMLLESIRVAHDAVDDQNLVSGLRVGGMLLTLLGVGWLVLFVFNFMSLIFAVCAMAAKGSPNQKQTACRVVATAMLALAMPTVCFFILTTFVSTAVLSVALKLVGDKPYASGGLAQAIVNVAAVEPNTKSIRTLIEQYWAAIAGVALYPLLPLLGIGAICLIWTLAPSVLSELKVPSKDTVCQRRAYGAWLDRSRKLLWIAGIAVYAASLCIAPAGIVGMVLFNPERNARSFPDADLWMARLFAWLGTLFAGVGTFWLLPQRLGDLTGRLAVPIRAALDVDAYLRLFPLEGNPKARIFARYTSLLRYIANWSEPADPGVQYDSIVIVSHSQGTVITADLFRYLKLGQMKDESLARLDAIDLPADKIPVRLLTLGSPLRQLYAARFPHLYQWANTMKSCGNNISEQMGIQRWINAFRSGDYVGRFLWHDESYWSLRYDKATDEFCAGPGAHVHYWDGTAKDVAEVIDDLIVAPTYSIHADA